MRYDPLRTVEILRFIKMNAHKRINRSGVAARFHVSPDYLSQLIRADTGLSFCPFLESLRMRRAERFLKLTLARVKEVSARAGFTSYSHFVNRFTAKHGVSPCDYRNAWRARRELVREGFSIRQTCTSPAQMA